MTFVNDKDEGTWEVLFLDFILDRDPFILLKKGIWVRHWTYRLHNRSSPLQRQRGCPRFRGGEHNEGELERWQWLMPWGWFR